MFLLQFSFFADAMLDPVDFLSLQAIRKSFHDLPGSNFFHSWDFTFDPCGFTSDPCGFAGVYCDGDKPEFHLRGDSGESWRGSPSQNARFELQSANENYFSVHRILTGALQFDSLPQSLNRINPSVSLAIANPNRSQTQQPHRFKLSRVSPSVVEILITRLETINRTGILAVVISRRGGVTTGDARSMDAPASRGLVGENEKVLRYVE
ncbi:hypothetical protein Bca4012_049767 [Brassica carinata]